ncbi:carbohydrate kinase [Labrys miyagiensis]|uniref:Carbohydrate kinase n=1 Tax=Labrys miyagiensis TaxID=346912 RepID=A0ABQ6CUW3_9HYPH|nr:carbohydrate kinase [Labrys miyagiensis]
MIDRVGETVDAKERLHTSNIGRMRSSLGGVARNVAENLALLGIPVRLLSRVGDDPEGERIIAVSSRAGIDMTRVTRDSQTATASYTAIFNGEGELVIGLADMSIFEAITPENAVEAIAAAAADTVLFADANLQPATLQAIAGAKSGRMLASVPVSIQKLARLAPILADLDILFLNLHEARALLGGEGSAESLAARLANGPVPRGLLTLGPRGALGWADGKVTAIPALASSPVNVNGAGDALAGATLARLATGDDFILAARRAMAAAALTVESPHTVRADLTMSALLARYELSQPTETIIP